PVVPLADLYAPCKDRIQDRRGEVRTRSEVATLCIHANEVQGVRLDDGTEMQSDYYVVALTQDHLMRILPEEVRSQDAFAQTQKLLPSPITSVHLWFDRIVMREPFITSLDQTIQWVFDKSNASADNTAHGQQYLQIVISASRGLRQRSQQEIVNLCLNELA